MLRLPARWLLLFVFFSTVIYVILNLLQLDVELNLVQVVGLLATLLGIAVFRHWWQQPYKHTLNSWDQVGVAGYFIGLALFESRLDIASNLVAAPTPVEMVWWTVISISVMLVWFRYLTMSAPEGSG